MCFHCILEIFRIWLIMGVYLSLPLAVIVTNSVISLGQWVYNWHKFG